MIRRWLERKIDELTKRNAGHVLATMSIMDDRDRVGGNPELPHRWHYALDIMRTAKLHSGAFMPAIEYLEARGAVKATWAPGPYPRRRLYRITTMEEQIPWRTEL